MTIIWKKEYELGIKIIDSQHQNFVVALNELIDAISSAEIDKSKVESVFQKIENYAQYRFQTEEKYFADFNYQGASEHIAEHQGFKVKFAEIKNRYLTDALESTFNLADFLEDWLFNHLNNEDKKYVECFHEHGLT